MALILCADIGSSSLKAALIDGSGALHGEARIPYGNEPGPGCWLSAFLSAARRLSVIKGFPGGTAATAERAPEDVPSDLIPGDTTPDLISGDTTPDILVISGSGPTLVPVIKTESGALESLPPIYWYDVPLYLEEPSGGRLVSFFLSKARRFRQQFPAEFEKLAYFFSPQEWLSWKLGAAPVTVLPHGGYEPYYWSEAECAAVQIDRKLFPPFVTMGTVIGSTAALPLKIPLAAGAADFIMALAGTGTLVPGAACDRTGSSEGLNLCVDRLPDNPESLPPRLRILPGVAEGLWNLGAVIDKSGKLFDDFRLSCGLEDKAPDELTAEILDNPSHPGRPVLDTVAGAFLEALRDLECSGHKIRELVLSGGQCGDPRWNRYKARISGKVLRVPEITGAELAGDAVLGALALEGKNVSGETLREKTAGMIRIRETFYP